MATRGEIRDRIRDRAGIRRSTVFTDTKLNSWINSAIHDLYDHLIGAQADYYTEEATLTIAGGASSVDLPSDFYKLRGIDLVDGTKHRKLKPFGIAERWMQDSSGKPTRYRMQQNKLVLAPKPSQDYDLRVLYTPTAPQYADDATEINMINGYERFVEFTVVRDVRLREQQPLNDVEREIANQVHRIQTSAPTRDSGSPMNLSQFTDEYDYDDFYR